MTLHFDYTAGEGHVTTVQWYLNGVALVDGVYGGTSVSGATTTTLTIDNPTNAYSGNYYAIVTDVTADCTLQTETVSVEAVQCTLNISVQTSRDVCYVAFTSQPENTNVAELGEATLTFTYTSVGDGPYTVLWYKDGTPLADGPTGSGSTISGATTTSLTISNAQLTDDGDYYAVVSNASISGCDNQTNTASLTVVAAPSVQDPDAYWRLNEINEPIVGGQGPATDRADQIAGSTLVLSSGSAPGYQDAQGGDAASLEFLNSSTGQLNTGNVAALAYTSPNSVSFSFWIKIREAIVSDNLPRFLIEIGAGGANGQIEMISNTGGGGTLLDIFIDGPSTSDFIEVDPIPISVGQWYLWTVVFDGGTGLVKFYIDTTEIASSSVPVTFTTAATGALQLRQVNFSTETLLSQMGLWMDYALTPANITDIYNAGAGTTCCPFP